MKNLLLTLLLLATANSVHAQTDTSFLDDYEITCPRPAAKYYRLYVPATGGGYEEETYLANTGMLKTRYHTLRSDTSYYDGPGATWYDNGAKESEGSYTAKMQHGTWRYYRPENGELWYTIDFRKGSNSTLTGYYAGGQVKCRQQYISRSYSRGKSYSEAGKKIKFTPFHVLAHTSYPLQKYLRNNLKYPAESQDAGMEGRMKVKFTVDSAGNVTNVRLVNHISPQIDAETIRVISQLPPWQPCMLDGKATSEVLTQPLSFKLK